jgi:hypothetical protein
VAVRISLSYRDRRAAIIGLVGAAAILGYALIFRPLASDAADLRQRREMAEEILLRYRGTLAARGGYEFAVDSAEALLQRLAPRAFVAGRAERAVSQLVQLLERAAEGNSVSILREVPLAADSVGPSLVSVGATVEVESDLRGLLGLLRTLEATEKLLHVSQLRLSRTDENTGDVESLRATFAMRGFVINLREGDDGETVPR